MLRLSRRSVCTALAVTDGAPLPTSFLIFKHGINATSKGNFLFDAQAAKEVLAQFALEGVELIVDREHDSLSEEARTARSDASDALAHYTLKLAADGSLWADNVVWNQAGEDDLRSKKRRYTSPAFHYDLETGRISQLLNVALVSMPATYGNAPLIAARRTTRANIATALSAKYPDAEIVELKKGVAIFERRGLLYSIAISGEKLNGVPVRVIRKYVVARAEIKKQADALIAQMRKGRG
jgi:hypothetical protein